MMTMPMREVIERMQNGVMAAAANY
jgi:hypothetical protein